MRYEQLQFEAHFYLKGVEKAVVVTEDGSQVSILRCKKRVDRIYAEGDLLEVLSNRFSPTEGAKLKGYRTIAQLNAHLKYIVDNPRKPYSNPTKTPQR